MFIKTFSLKHAMLLLVCMCVYPLPEVQSTLYCYIIYIKVSVRFIKELPERDGP